MLVQQGTDPGRPFRINSDANLELLMPSLFGAERGFTLDLVELLLKQVYLAAAPLSCEEVLGRLGVGGAFVERSAALAA